jgi:hypothetical protein
MSATASEVGRAIGSGWQGPPNFREWSGPTSERLGPDGAGASKPFRVYHGQIVATRFQIRKTAFFLRNMDQPRRTALHACVELRSASPSLDDAPLHSQHSNLPMIW